MYLLGAKKLSEKKKEVRFRGQEDKQKNKVSAGAKEHLAFNLVVSKVLYG